ncbi:MAG: cell envelope biogenesis protein OmpA [Aquificota bacterium]|nr:MAG: cell envelope biogenesis protein OmpA [Aquificota bacterium]
MLRKQFLLFAGLALFSVGASQAEGIKDKFIYTPYVGYHIFSCKREGKVGNNFYDLKDTPVGGISFEKVFTNFGVGILGDYGQSTLKGTNTDRDSYDWAVFGSYYENAGDRLIPFVSLGIGGNFMNHKTLTGIYGAAGLRYVFNESLGVKIAIQDFYLWKGRHDIVPIIGLDVMFGGVSDSDRDGVPDDRDRCPGTPLGVKVNSVGCPVDTDKDGIPDYMDRCPNTPLGVAVYRNGCPVDSDKDGVPDYMDRCPNTPEGYKVDEKGCFVEVKLEVHFDSDKAVVKPEYYPVIEKFAKFLKENPKIKVEIQGHTDSSGSEKYNLILSQKRAEAVKRILVEKYGISPDRIVAKGYGESQPIAPNDTEEGKAKNRRVVAKIIK